MALYYDPPIDKDVCRLIITIFEHTKDFSREYKVRPGQDLKRDSTVLVRSIYPAWPPAALPAHRTRRLARI